MSLADQKQTYCTITAENSAKQTFVAQVLLPQTYNMPVTSFAAVSDRFSVCFQIFG